MHILHIAIQCYLLGLVMLALFYTIRYIKNKPRKQTMPKQANKLYSIYQDEIDQFVEFLTWLEDVFPDRLEFTDKNALAKGFVAHKTITESKQWPKMK